MKKRFITIISFLMTVLLGFGVLSGCKLITTDIEKDMSQVVATVCIEEGAPVDEIKKQEMIMAYLNYGYYYVYNNGYSNEQVFGLILNSLVENRILIQNAMKDIDSGVAPYNTIKTNNDKAKWDIERYLTNFDGISQETGKISDMNEARYQTIVAMNEMVEGYVETETSNKFGDSVTFDERTTPTDAANKVDETTEQEKLEVIAKGVVKGELGTKELKAYNKALKMMETNGLLGEGFSSLPDAEKKIENTDYFKNSLKTSQENVLLKKYQNAINLNNRKKITFETLYNNYDEMYKAQKEKYDLSQSDFKTALENATAESPIVYNAYSGYGYVYNLLVGVNSIQEAKISELEGTTLEKQAARQDILKDTIIKDLRAPWILNGYDFDYDKKTFTGDYTFVEDDSLPFHGEVTCLKEKDEENDEPAEYRVDEIFEYNIDEFIKIINKYVYGNENVGNAPQNTTDPNAANYEPWMYWEYYRDDSEGKPANYDDKINELLFAFSTDGGSLNKYKGYLISPKPDGADAETYMQEFADAGRRLLEKGGSSYVIAATDYGYHIMFYSEIIKADTGYANLVDYLNYLFNENKTYEQWEDVLEDMVANWDDYEDTDSYLYKLMNAYSTYVSNELTEAQQKIVEKYNNDTNVIKYTDRYQDLLK